jgi:ribose transport system substrate-binding protein
LQVNIRARLELLEDLRAQGVKDVIGYLDQNPDFLRRVLDGGTVEDANQRAVQMLGARDASQLIGSTASFFWEESPATFRRALESRFRGELTFQEEAKFTTLDGRVIDVLITIARSDPPGMNLVGLIDISERIRAQQMLQRVQADFAHAARVSMLGELTASIAHELNQPLAAIAMHGEVGLHWLGRAEPNLAEVRESMERTITGARRAAEIIARIRAMAVRREPEQGLVSLDEVIREALLFLRHELQSRAVTVSHHPAVAAPKVLADRTQIQQVIVNLVVNAIQAMAQAGVRDGKISIRTALRDPATLMCTVEDSGPGIKPEHLPRLFDSFFTTKEAGMGIGLSICRSIIESHGGRITADSQAAHGGARLYFTLPAHGAATTPTSEIKLTDAEIAQLKDGKYTAALLSHTLSDFANAVTAGATDELNRLGISVVATADSGFDAAKQKSDIETVLAKKPNAILALPLDPATSAEAFRPAVEAGTKIVLLSNTPAGYVQGKDYVAVVTDDLFQMGKQAADALAAVIGKKGKVACIYHDAQYYVTNQRDNAFKTTIEKDYPEIKIVAQQGIADPARAGEIANALLLKNPDLDGIYVTWAEPAEGVLAVLRAAGNTHTKIVTLDLSEPIALDMVQGGNVAAIVADQAYELGRAMATVAGYGLVNKQPPSFIVAGVITVTKANVSQGWQTSLHRDPPQSVIDALK